ncbi:MAG: hypothetical protein ACI4I2_09570 [Oscillospiraceae bacterium]
MDSYNGQPIEERFQPMLFSDEYIVRCGEGRQVNSGGAPLPFAIIWTGFAILWTAIAFFSGGGVFALFGLPFIVIGVGLFIQFFRGGNKEYYALTNLRVIILSGKETRAEYYDRIKDARVYPAARGKFAVRISAEIDVGFSGDSLFGEIVLESSTDAEYLCREILSEKERYTAYKNEQRK